jgi:hypothetical protein
MSVDGRVRDIVAGGNIGEFVGLLAVVEALQERLDLLQAIACRLRLSIG